MNGFLHDENSGHAAHGQGMDPTDCPWPPGDRATAWLSGWQSAERWRARGVRGPSEAWLDDLVAEAGIERY